jgi:membrane protein
MAKTDAPLAHLLRIFGQRFVEDRCLQIASSLTFTTLLAIVPIVAIALALVGAFPVFGSLMNHVQEFVLQSLVPKSVNAIAAYAEQFSENAARLTVVGVIFLGITALTMMFTIERAFNDIWHVPWRRRWLQRILVYWAVLTIGPLCIGASLSVTSYVVTVSFGLVSPTAEMRFLAIRLIPLVLTSLAFALTYYAVPNRRVRRSDALVGGVIAGMCFEAMKQGFGYYIAYFPTYKLVYGAFATVPIFLLWIYLSWLIILGGAVLVAALPEWRERAGQSRPVPGSDFFDALQVLKMLWRAHRSGSVVELSMLHPVVKVRIEHLEKILATLAAAGWIARSGADGWILIQDAVNLKLEALYRMFVFHTDAHVPARHASAELESLVFDISARIGGQLQMSLEQLFSQTEMRVDNVAAAGGVGG